MSSSLSERKVSRNGCEKTPSNMELTQNPGEKDDL